MSGGDENTPAREVWLETAATLPSVHGFAEGCVLLNDARLRVEYHNLIVAMGACKGRAGEAGQRGLLNLNGDEHKRLRSEVAPGFRPKSVDRIRSFARETARQLLDAIENGRDFDFMAQFATPYIERTTGEYIGFPQADLASLSEPLALMTAAVTDLKNRASDFDAGCIALLDYATDALRARSHKPTSDVLGDLSRLIKQGAVDELFAANLVVTLLSAGLEPTILQMGLLIEEFSKLPAVWNTIGSDALQTPPVLEEMLRLRSTNQSVMRCVHAPVTQHDFSFTKGSKVLINIGAANHDPRRYGRPEAFDMNANRGSHLAFGFGPHHCLGAPLVRAQLQEALQVLSAEFDCPEVTDVVSKRGQGLTGPLELTIRVQRRKP